MKWYSMAAEQGACRGGNPILGVMYDTLARA